MRFGLGLGIGLGRDLVVLVCRALPITPTPHSSPVTTPYSLLVTQFTIYHRTHATHRTVADPTQRTVYHRVPQRVPRLPQRVQETYKVRIIDSSPHGAFQLRLHERNAPHALVYQIHLSWHWYTLTATTLEQVLQRRQPRAVPEGCLEVVSAEDDEMLRKVERAAKPSKKGRCLSAAATSPSISRMPSPPPPALRTAPWLEEALAGRVASPSIPRRIWTFWDSGADGAPTVVRHAITSWVVRNPTWRVTLLTDRDVLGYLEGFSGWSGRR